MPAMAILHHHSKASVAHDRRIREHLSDDLWMFAFVTRFLTQFALTSSLRRSVGAIYHSARNFQFYRVRPVTILLDHHQALIGSESNDIHPVHRIDDKKVMLLLCARRNLAVRSDRENPEVAARFGADL